METGNKKINKGNAMFLLTFSHISDKSDLKNTSDKRKVIRMQSKGFCIAVFSDKRKTERLFQYSFEANTLSVKDKLEAIATANQELDIDCKNNYFRLYTQYNTQIPSEFYQQESDKAILPLIVEHSEKYVPVAEKVEDWNIYNVSAWEKNLHRSIKKKFPDYELGTVLSSLLPIIAREKNGKDVLVFVDDNNFTIIATDRHKMLGMNTFDFVNEGDFFYYLYGFLRKMYIYPDTVSLKLGGNIAHKSLLYNVLAKYFSSVEMVSSYPCPIDNYSYFCDLFE